MSIQFGLLWTWSQKMAKAAPKLNIALPMDEIAAFCRRWQITELAVFGSVLRDDFRPGSDIDFLVTFAPNVHRTLFDLQDMEEELAAMTGRKVDIISRAGIERSQNWIRRRSILDTAEPVYVAG